ncbi:MAG: HAD family hydrolase [candidate division KSB1 bacterium]|nr:HAD family hydrolase [candidate division KSB1 bacterium]MDZ7341788.1 HAD family hydrolase [candidate division KSB1 bacterium]
MNNSKIISKTNLEIVRSFDGRNITTVLFDFDGTLSRERDGWINLMVATCSGAMVQALPQMAVTEAIAWIIREIESTIGIPTYQQMKRMADEIIRRGGQGLSPQRYKDVYTLALEAMVKTAHQKMLRGELSIGELRVPGAIDLLEKLAAKLGREALFLASGTDIKPIQESVRFLGYEQFFGDRIIASGSNGNHEECPKQAIVETLVAERKLKPGQLLTFGDGVPEIKYTRSVGGITVGVLSPDQSHYAFTGHFTIAGKKKRLIDAGAHVLVPDFRSADELLEVVFSKQVGHE